MTQPKTAADLCAEISESYKNAVEYWHRDQAFRSEEVNRLRDRVELLENDIAHLRLHTMELMAENADLRGRLMEKERT